ncbi:hypothetical protein A2823_02810 [Candidatus Nomurabacteria bacterium RIFCSPHIGHO2_01_FULL_41_91]|nr:MAG: hypothetical protein A2823_02810 [Candidatus Nomurabacteria bacterium RIFCSPHIGHO2_01_FULL_41_91]OGI99631.1 MAG: hypothetical protein A3H56_02015 [Candidatus Nomurabacteria bacterium RIFCSPLOWO2_02_FULL_42_24]
MRFIMPIILIGIAVSVFFVFANPLYEDVSALKIQATAYNEALDNSKMLENERDKLTAKYNAVDPENLIKIKKLLPENVDNIRLILEIEQMASPYGMVLKDVKYNTTDTNAVATTTTAVVQGGIAKPAHKDYGIFDLEFSTSGTYHNFINFTKNLESNLRIVDISSIAFSSDTGVNINTKSASSSEVYKYNFHIRTYWLKN